MARICGVDHSGVNDHFRSINQMNNGGMTVGESLARPLKKIQGIEFAGET